MKHNIQSPQQHMFYTLLLSFSLHPITLYYTLLLLVSYHKHFARLLQIVYY